MSQPSNLPLLPLGVSIDRNIADAKEYAATHSLFETYLWFCHQVKNKGPWDFKQSGSQYEFLGNWHFGVIGAALGIPEVILLRMAGAVQIFAGTSTPEWGNPLWLAPYGDDPADQEAIRQGIEWAGQNGHETSMLFPELPIRLPMTWAVEGWGGINTYAIATEVNTRFTSSRKNSSPLVLDLDGDGIEITPLTGAITFDHNADGIATGTAWVQPDDGLLVFDRNGDGRIDSGRELFGNHTWLQEGTMARDGYAALGWLDSHQDGVLDARDVEFRWLQVWRDLDQDGVTDDGELQGLDQLGISSISLAQTPSSETLPDGTRLQGMSSFVRDGSTHAYTDAWFAVNPFHRRFIDGTTNEPINEPVLDALPDMRGSGAVRDLRDAASRSPALRDLLATLAAADTREAQRRMVLPLLTGWADTSDFVTVSDWAAAGHEVTFDLYRSDEATTASLGDRIAILEAFNGQSFVTLQANGSTRVWTGSTRQRLLQESWAALDEGVYGALALQTRLAPYLDAIDIVTTRPACARMARRCRHC